jgi:hypothetical protein
VQETGESKRLPPPLHPSTAPPHSVFSRLFSSVLPGGEQW